MITAPVRPCRSSRSGWRRKEGRRRRRRCRAMPSRGLAGSRGAPATEKRSRISLPHQAESATPTWPSSNGPRAERLGRPAAWRAARSRRTAADASGDPGASGCQKQPERPEHQRAQARIFCAPAGLLARCRRLGCGRCRSLIANPLVEGTAPPTRGSIAPNHAMRSARAVAIGKQASLRRDARCNVRLSCVHMQARDQRVAGERVEEFLEQFGVHLADLAAGRSRHHGPGQERPAEMSMAASASASSIGTTAVAEAGDASRLVAESAWAMALAKHVPRHPRWCGGNRRAGRRSAWRPLRSNSAYGHGPSEVSMWSRKPIPVEISARPLPSRSSVSADIGLAAVRCDVERGGFMTA